MVEYFEFFLKFFSLAKKRRILQVSKGGDKFIFLKNSPQGLLKFMQRFSSRKHGRLQLKWMQFPDIITPSEAEWIFANNFFCLAVGIGKDVFCHDVPVWAFVAFWHAVEPCVRRWKFDWAPLCCREKQ